MTRFTKLAAAAAAAAILVPGAVAAEGESGASASFTSLDVAASDGAINVSGVSTFNGEAVVVGSDATGDALLPGADFGNATITQDPKTGDLIAALDLVDALPESGTAPAVTFFEWNIGFAGSEGVALQAQHTNQNNPGEGWYFSVVTFSVDPATGTGSFSPSAANGEFTGSQLVWHVSPAQLGAKPGDKLVQGERGPIRSSIGGAGLFTFTAAHFDDMVMDSFVVGGGARVKVLDGAGETVDSGLAKVRRGEFSIRFDDLEPGTYTVEVTTEYGDGSTTETRTVTVA